MPFSWTISHKYAADAVIYSSKIDFFFDKFNVHWNTRVKGFKYLDLRLDSTFFYTPSSLSDKENKLQPGNIISFYQLSPNRKVIISQSLPILHYADIV